MSFITRKKLILTTLESDHYVTIPALASSLGVASITIRRDLEKLAAKGLLVRTHGGASKREASFNELLLLRQARSMEEAKKRIGAAAAAMVKAGDVIFLDTGTTTLQIAGALKNTRDITIVTNSILVLAELAYGSDVNLILLGGSYRTGTFTLSGPITARAIENFRANIAFIGADGISPGGSVTTNDIYTAQITELMLKYSAKSVLVTDHTKIARTGTIRFAEIGDFDLLITDQEADITQIKGSEKSDLTIVRV